MYERSDVHGAVGNPSHRRISDGNFPARIPAGSGAPREGLTPAQVEQSRKQHGSNQLTQKKRNSFFRQFLSSFGDPIIKILLIALAVNVLFLFRHFDWYESAGIALAIFLATFVSTLSEYGSESAFEKMQEDAARITCRVRRSGGVVPAPHWRDRPG